jgi:tetratricopeptide (TPR) repeat protein
MPDPSRQSPQSAVTVAASPPTVDHVPVPELPCPPSDTGSAAPAFAAAETVPPVPALPRADPLPQVPGYDLLGRLGRGGMGVVYQARHQRLRRLTALKMIRGGAAAGPDELARFRAESEAIARLQHPHIVQIFEVGEYDGLPFFALEFCPGGALDRKLAGTPLPAADAAELVEQLARAMHAAHQKGILHRDLKPGNVLLAEDGTPKISDFGLAKQLDPEPVAPGQAPTGSLTQSGAVVGTPSYMAPEQASGQGKALGPACDIYALGAILYECLTGRPPHKGATMLDTLWQVRQQEPVPPARLNPRVPRDLDTVCLTCLAKEPARRYTTALALAEDLCRFQAGEPIVARPIGRLERLAKWARRRPAVAALTGGLAAALLALLAALTTGIVLTTAALDQARTAEQVAETRRVEAERASTERELARQAAVTEKIQARNSEASAKQSDQKAQKRSQQLENTNRIVLSILHDLNPRLEKRGGLPLLVQLGQHLEKAADLLQGDAVGDPLTVARLQRELGQTLLNLGYTEQAIKVFAAARQCFEAELDPDHPDLLGCLNELAAAFQAQGQLARALPLYELVETRLQAQSHPSPDLLLTNANNLAAAYVEAGLGAKAVPLLDRVLRTRLATLGASHPDTLTTLNNLAEAYMVDGQFARGVPLLEEALIRVKERCGPDHADTFDAMNNLAGAYQASGQLARALPLFEETLAKRQALLGPDHPDTLTSMNNLGSAHRAAGQLAKALSLLEDTLVKRKAKLGADHPETLTSVNNLAAAYRAAGRLDSAVQLYEEALEKAKLVHGPDNPRTLAYINNLAVAYQNARQPAKALPLFETALAKRQAQLGPDHPDTLHSMHNLAVAYDAGGQRDKALPLLEKALALRRARLGPDHPDTLATTGALALVYCDLERYGDAEPLLATWTEKQRPQLAADDLKLAWRLNQLGACRVALAKYADAEAPLREGLAIYQKKLPQNEARYDTQSLLGAALAGQKKYAEAEPLLLASANVLKSYKGKLTAVQRQRVLAAVRRVVDLYEAWQRPEDAERWRKELEALMPSVTSGGADMRD